MKGEEEEEGRMGGWDGRKNIYMKGRESSKEMRGTTLGFCLCSLFLSIFIFSS